MQILTLTLVAFLFVLLAFAGLGICAITGRRQRPGSCSHDPTEPHEPGQPGCDVCGGDPEKCDQNQ